MKLVIDIPDNDYKFIKDLQSLIIGGRGNCKTIQYNIINAIKNGTPYEERQKGKWLKSSNMSKRSYQRLCSNCKHIVYFCGDGNYPNCPYCLADMRGDV